MVRFLLEERADVNARNNFNSSPLDWAAGKNRAEEMKILLAAKANIMVVDKHGRTPLHAAAIDGGSEAVRILVEAERKASFLEAKDFSGQTAMGFAKAEGHAKVQVILKDAGARR